MNPEFRARAEALFEQALELDPTSRARWLDERVRQEEDPAVVEQVRRLLEAHRKGSPLLDRGVGRVELPPAERASPPRPIGPYRLLGEIGRGGMSVVYRAERADGQFRSRVAIKFLRGDLDAEELHARLAAERQILAALDHPNIARLLDGGVTDEGRPYLVMEYVDGVPIQEYVTTAGLDVESRLRLFLDVARAVQHAHGRLVIHRDLKPSNILVTPDGRVRLLDFGIAKVLDVRGVGLARSDAPRTRTGHRLFTPEYASPEQIRGEPAATSNDVWALGVLLFELLVGARPFDLDDCTPGEGERRILEAEPPRPSQVAGTPILRRRLQGDLDRIVAMALRKDPARRYLSVEQLADDVVHHLEGRPVRAQPDTFGYRLGKFLRRHRVESAAAAVVIVAVVGGVAAALWQAGEARRERDRAAQEALRSEAVAAYLLDLFQAADPWEVPADRLSARELLSRGTRRLEELPADPLLRARLLLAIGQTWLQLGDARSASPLLEEALELRRAALGEDHPETGEARLALGELLRREGRLPQAEALARQVLDAGAGLENRALSLLGFIHTGMGRTDDARRDFEEELARLEVAGLADSEEAGHALVNLAAIHRRQARYAEAEAFLRRALAHRREHLGPDHPLAAVAMARLAGLLSEHMGRPDEAAPLFEAALEIQARVLGPDHPARIESIGGLALIREGDGDLPAAEALHREHLDIHVVALGTEHPSTLAAREGLADFLARTGRPDSAQAIYAATVPLRRAMQGPLHPSLAGSLLGHGRVLLAQGRVEAAEEAIDEALRIREEVFGPDHALVGLTLAELATARGARGDAAGERELVARGLAILEAFHPPNHPETLALRARHAALAPG
jgi:eukaryotic-like serine/threonine-protein kinase